MSILAHKVVKQGLTAGMSLALVWMGTLTGFAADRYWSGGSSSSDNIDQGANWHGGTTPSSGDNLYFNNTTGSRHWPYSNYASGSWFGYLITYSGAGGIKWRGDKTWAYKFENNNDSTLFEIEANIENRSGSDLELNPAGSGGMKITGYVNVADASKWIKVYGNNQLEVTQVISGASGATMTIMEAAKVILTAENTFPGSFNIYGGVLDLRNTTDPLDVGDIYIGKSSGSANATLRIGANGVTVDNALHTVSGNTGIMRIDYDVDSGSGTFTNTLTLNKDVVLAAKTGGRLNLSGNINNAYKVVAGGSSSDGGTVRLTGTGSGYSGKTEVKYGTLEIDNDRAVGAVPGAAEADHLKMYSGSALVALETFTLDSKRGITIDSGNFYYAVASGKTLTHNGIIAESTSGGIIKNQAGTLILGGNSTYAGGTYVDNGILQLAHNSAAGSGTVTIGYESDTANNATLVLPRGRSIANAVTFRRHENTGYPRLEMESAGSGDVTVSGRLTLERAWDNTGYEVLVTNASSGGVLYLTGGFNLNGGSYNENRAVVIGGDVRVSGDITNAPSGQGLVLRGPGPVTISSSSIKVPVYQDSGAVTFGSSVSFPDEKVWQLGTKDNTVAAVYQANASLTLPNSGTFKINMVAGQYAASGSPGTRTFNFTHSSGDIEIQGSVDLDQHSGRYLVLNNPSRPVVVTGTLTGKGGIWKTGAALLTLSGNASYESETRIQEGQLKLGSSSVLAGAPKIILGFDPVAVGTPNDVALYVVNGGDLKTPVEVKNNASGTGTRTIGVHPDDTTAEASLNAEITLGKATVFTAPGTASIIVGGTGGKLTGSGGVSKEGTGRVRFQGANDYTAQTLVNAGVLSIEHANALGGTANNTVVANGAALEIRGGITTVSEPLTLNGPGLSSGGALRNTADNNTYAGLITLALASRINSDSGTLTLDVAAGNALTGTYNLTMGGDGHHTVNDPIATDTGTLTKDGSGTLTLSAANTYSGAITISAGKVVANHDTALGTVAGGVTVADGAALELAGTRTIGAEALTLNGTGIGNGGALRNPSGSDTYGGLVTLAAASRINSDADTLTLNPGSGNSIESANLNLTLGGAGNITVSRAITAGTGSLTKDGAGTLTLSAANTYSGGSTISAGTVIWNNNSALGSGTVTLNDANTPGGATPYLYRNSSGTLTLNITVADAGSGNPASIGKESGNVSLTYSGTLTLNKAAYLRDNSASGTTTFSGQITGSGAINKTGDGVVRFSNAGNNFSGATSVDAGTLRMEGGANRFSSASALTIQGGATFDLNDNNTAAATLTGAGAVTLGSGTMTLAGNGSTTYSGVMTGTGGLTKQGSGVLTLSGANEYTGATMVEVGTLRLGNHNRLSDSTAVSVSVGATLDLAGYNETVATIAGAGAVTLAAGTLTTAGNGSPEYSGIMSGTGSLTKQGTGTLTLSGPNTFEGGLTISGGTVSIGSGGASGSVACDIEDNAALVFNRSDNLTYNGEISGSGTVTKLGEGILTLGGDNSHEGLTTVSEGALRVGHQNALGTTDAGTTVTSGAALQIGGGVTTTTEALTLNGTGVSSDGALRSISGNNTYAGLITLTTAARINSDADTLTLDVAAGNALEGNFALMLGGAGNVTVNDPIATGANTLTKDGAGTLTLSGNNTYSGNTTLGGGTLVATTSANALGAGGLILNTAATTLRLQNDSGLDFARNTTVSASMTIDSDRLTSGAAVTHTLGSLGIGANTLSITKGAHVASGTAGLTFGTTTFSADGAVLDTAAGVNLTLGALGGNYSITKQGEGMLTLGTASTRNHANAAVAINGGLVVVQQDDALGTHGTANTIPIGVTGAILEINGSGLALNNGLVVTLNEGGVLRSSGNNSTFARLSLAADSAGTIATVGVDDTFTIGNGANDVYGGDATAVMQVAGPGTVLLAQSSTYSGNWSLDAGTLLLQSSANPLGQTSARTLTLNGGALTAQYDTSPGLDYTGGPGNNVVLAANATITSDRETDGIGRTFVFGNLSLGAYTLSIAKGARVTSGTAAVTFSGATVLSGAPTLDVASGAKLTLGTVDTEGYLLTVQGAGNTEITDEISDTGGVQKDGAGTLFLTGANTFTGTLDIDAGTVSVGAGGSSGSVAANIANDGALVFNRSDATEYAGVISGAGTLTKLGADALTLSGTSPAFNGATTVSVGTLIVSGSLANSAVTVLNNATNKGSGTVGALTVNSGGTVAPGDSDVLRGALTVASLSFQDGAKFRVKIGDVAGAGVDRSDRDYIVNNGACSLTGTTTVQLDSSQAANWHTTTDHVWTVISGGITATNGFVLDTSTYCTLDPGGGAFTLEAADNNLQIVYDDDVAVPLTNNVNLAGAAAAPFVVATNGTAPSDAIRGFISRRTGSGTNIVSAITDAEMATSGDLGLQFVFGARDVNSGVSRGTSGGTNVVMSFSLGEIVTGNFANYNAGLSTEQTTTNQVLTNYWTFANDEFSGATITALMAANQTVRMRAPDTDNDRPNDRAILAGQQVGYLRVVDDDIRGPIVSSLAVEGAFDPEKTYFESFEPATGWTEGTSFSGEWTKEKSYGTYIASGNVLWGSLNPKVSGTRRIGLLTNVAETITTLQLPPVSDPAMLTLMAGRFGAEGAENDVEIRLDWLNGSDWTSLGPRTVTYRDPEFEMFTWNLDLPGVVTLRVVRVSITGPQVYMDDINITPMSAWISTNQLQVSWAEAVEDFSAVDEYRLVLPGTNSVAPTAVTDGDVQRPGDATDATLDISDRARQGVLTGYLFANDDDSDRTGDRAMGNVKPIVVKVDRTRPTTVPDLLVANDEVDDPSTQFDLAWNAEEEEMGPDALDDTNHPHWPSASDRNLLSPWDTYKIYYGPWDPLEGGAEYIWDNFITNQYYTNWPAVTRTTPIEDANAAEYQPDYGDLLDPATKSIRLYDLEPGQDYVIVIVGMDEAGNESRPGASSWATNDTIRFAITSAWTIAKAEALAAFPEEPCLDQTASSNATALSWVAAGKNGQVIKEYDLIFMDTNRFQESTNNQWQLVGTQQTNWFAEDGGFFKSRGQLRFYRASYKDRWRNFNTNTLAPQRPLASEEVYALHNVILSGGQNFVALHGVPYTNTFAAVFGTNLFPGGPSALPDSGATVVEFYSHGIDAPIADTYFLTTGGRWWQAQGGSGDVTTNEMESGFFSRGFSITLPNPVPEAFATTTAWDYNHLDPQGNPVVVPAMVWTPVLQVPTNDVEFSHVIYTGTNDGRVVQTVYNVCALRLPVAAHPSQMNLLNGGFVKGTRNLGDQIYTMDTSRKTMRSDSTIYCGLDDKWRFVSTDVEVVGGYFKPNDVIVIVSKNWVGEGSWVWTYNPTNFYNLPTRWMGY